MTDELRFLSASEIAELEERSRKRRQWQLRLWLEAEHAISMRESPRTQLRRFSACAISLDSQDRLYQLLPLLQMLEPPLFWRALRQWWSVCDDTWSQLRPLLRLMREHADSAPVRRLKNQDVLYRVYRGCSRAAVRGISWTTDREVAGRFARGHRIPVPNPVIVSARVRRSAVFLHIGNQRKEREWLLDPRRLVDVEIAPAEPANTLS